MSQPKHVFDLHYRIWALNAEGTYSLVNFDHSIKLSEIGYLTDGATLEDLNKVNGPLYTVKAGSKIHVPFRKGTEVCIRADSPDYEVYGEVVEHNSTARTYKVLVTVFEDEVGTDV